MNHQKKNRERSGLPEMMMKRSMHSRVMLHGFLFALLTLKSQQASAIEKADKVSFKNDVAPILALRCQGCHHEKKASMGLDLTSYAKLRQGGKQSGPDEILVPGKPEESKLWEVLLADAQPRMPLKLKPLGDQEIQIVRRWIEQGATCDAPSPEAKLSQIVAPEKLFTTQNLANTNKPAAKPVIALTGDGQKLAVGDSGFVSIFDLRTNEIQGEKIGPVTGRIQSIWVDPASSFLVVASGRAGIEGLISKWEISSGKKVFEKQIHSDQILSMSVSAELKMIATGSYDKTVALTDIQTGSNLGLLKEHTDAIYAVALGPAGGNRLLSASGDRTLKLWDLKSRKRLETMSESTAELYATAISADGRTGYSAGVDRTIRAYDLTAQPPRLIQSALAHEAPITSLQSLGAANGAELVSTSEDRSVRRWNRMSLKQSGEIQKFKDWPLSVSSIGTKIAVASYDGSISIFESSPKSLKAIWLKPAGSARGGTPDSFKPQLARLATLNPPTPRILVAGQESVVTFTGHGLDQATKLWVFPADLSAEILRSKEIKPNTIQVRLKLPARSRFDIASIRFATPMGITPEQTFGISPGEVKTMHSASVNRTGKSLTVKSGEILQTTIAAPGDEAQARIELKAGELLTVSVLAQRLNSTLNTQLRLKSETGQILATSSGKLGRDPILSYQAKESGQVVLEVADSQFTGSGNHFAYLQIDSSQTAIDHWPDARSSGKQTTVTWVSSSGATAKTELKADNQKDTSKTTALSRPDGWLQDNAQSIVTVSGDVISADSSTPILKVNDAGIGRFMNPSDLHGFRFSAKKGQRLIVETFARRLGRDVDTALEITDEKHFPVTNITLRKVTDTLIAFRDHASTIKGIRLTQWPDFQMGNYVLINREVARIFQLPRNPDDDCLFWGDEQRWGYFGTTPEQHPMSRTVTKVEIVEPGQESSIDPKLLLKIPYANDDAGMTYGNDSHMDFTAPADGIYHVRIRETQGHFGPGISYAVVVREPKPDFQLSISPMDWNIPAGGSRLITATIRRIDDFQGPVSLEIQNLPKGWIATPGVIEAGHLSADLLVEVPAVASHFTPDATWKIIANAQAKGAELKKEITGAGRGWAATPKSNIRMTAAQDRVEIRPGEISTSKLKAERAEAFTGRIPIDVKNLPYGVRVLDIGLNGVLITERETERVIRIYAEPWVEPQTRPFFAVGRAENAGTADSTPPVILDVKPVQTQKKSTSVSAMK